MRDNAAYAALKNLVGQLEDSGWRDRHGHRIEQIVDYIEARELIEVEEALRAQGPPWSPTRERR